jgi:hypothetical protein
MHQGIQNSKSVTEGNVRALRTSTQETVKVIQLTPDLAHELLAKNTINRPLRKHHIAHLAREMKAGRWKYNGDPIRVSVNGDVLDGQHRMHAVVASGLTIKTVLVEGLEADAYDTIDSGLKRSRADVLSASGEVCCKTLSAALIFVDRYFTGRMSGGLAPANSEMVGLLNKYPEVRDAVRFVGMKRHLVPGAMLAGLYYLFSHVDDDDAKRFVNDVVKGAGLKEHDPVYLLRERLMKNALSKAKLRQVDIAALSIKAWNHRRAGSKLRTLAWRSTGDAREPFPVVSSH